MKVQLHIFVLMQVITASVWMNDEKSNNLNNSTLLEDSTSDTIKEDSQYQANFFKEPLNSSQSKHKSNKRFFVPSFLEKYNIIPLLSNFSELTSFPHSAQDSFEDMEEHSQVEILTALKSFMQYSTSMQKANIKRRNMLKKLTKQQQKLCNEVGYLKRLKEIDHLIERNQELLYKVKTFILQELGITERHFKLLQNLKKKKHYSPSGSNFRVIEGLLHYLRDWDVHSTEEIDGILQYVINQIEHVVPPEGRRKTCVVVPGSGVGRIAHEIATMGNRRESFNTVYAIENSGIMHLFNRFIYNKDKDSEIFDIYPYLHSFSNQQNTSLQLRRYGIHYQSKPKNLVLKFGDFRKLTMYENAGCDNIIVVTVFLVDTASNVLNYLDAIEKISKPDKERGIKNGYWINVGPLKYGSLPLVELNLEEIHLLRNKLGWADINSLVTLDNPNQHEKFMGYLTDKQSLWQAYYAVAMWCSQRLENNILLE